MTTATPKLHRTTYLGVAALIGSTKLTNGRRIDETHWVGESVGQPMVLPAGTVRLRLCKGDGRKTDYVLYAERIVPEGTTHPEAVDAARDELVDEHQRMIAPATDDEMSGL